MKPIFAKILNDIDSELFAIRTFAKPVFATEFHFHKECQINFVMQTTGKRIIGDSIEPFEEGEITFLGSNLPHVWYNDTSADTEELMATSVTLFIDPQKLIEAMRYFSDTAELERFLTTAKRGILFQNTDQETIKKNLLRLIDYTGIKQTIAFLELIDSMVNAQEYQLISSAGFSNHYSLKDNSKIDKVFRHMFDNYNREIPLEEIAQLANMTKHAFCRYFKSRTQKSFIEFLNEIRISNASQMMTQEQKLIGNIAYECGFGSLSNFNKVFKSIKGLTPTEYKKQLNK